MSLVSRLQVILIKNTDDTIKQLLQVKVLVGTFAARTAGTHGNNLLVST